MPEGNKPTFIFLCSLVIILSFSVQATAALLPTLAEYFGRPAVTVGRIIWLYMVPYGLCALVWAPLSRKLPVKKIILFCLAVFSLSALSVALSFNLSMAFAGRLFMGVFGSAVVPLSLITIGKEFDYKNRAKYIGLFFSCGFGSGLLGVFLSGILPWRFIYGIPALLGITAVFLGYIYLKDYDYTGGFRISYIDTFKDKGVLKLFFFIFALSFCYHSVQQWLGVYLAQKYAFNQFSISFALTLSALAAIFSESIGGILTGRFGPAVIACCGILSMGIFLFATLAVNVAWAVFILIVFWGTGWAFNHVGLSSFLTGLPDRFLRDASSLNSSLRFIAGGLGTYLGGKIISVWGFSFHFAGIGALILGLAFFLRKSLKVNKPQEVQISAV